MNKGKYIFDNVSKKFYDINTGEMASKNIQEYLQNPDIINAIDKGLTKYLGVGGTKWKKQSFRQSAIPFSKNYYCSKYIITMKWF